MWNGIVGTIKCLNRATSSRPVTTWQGAYLTWHCALSDSCTCNSLLLWLTQCLILCFWQIWHEMPALSNIAWLTTFSLFCTCWRINFRPFSLCSFMRLPPYWSKFIFVLIGWILYSLIGLNH
jgi:uncharacterized membrane protein YczE